MEKKFICPACNKTYASLRDVNVCIEAHIKEEAEVEKEKARQGGIKLEKEIQAAYDKLKEVVNLYNEKYADKHTFTCSLTTSMKEVKKDGKTTTSTKGARTTTVKPTELTLEELIDRIFG